MGQRRKRNPLPPQEIMDVAEEISHEPSSGSQNPVAPISDSEELENSQAQGVSQDPLTSQEQPTDRTELLFKRLEISLNVFSERISRLEERVHSRASHSRSRSPLSRPRSRPRYSGSPSSSFSRENSRASSHYSRRESHSRSPVNYRHYRDSSSSRNLWRSPSPSRKRKLSYPSDFSSDSSDSLPHHSRDKRRRSSPSEEDIFRQGGETWIKFKRGIHKHVKGDPTRIFWGKDLITVKWSKGPTKAFCQIKSKPSSAPYFDQSDSCSHLEEFLNLVPLTGESLGLKRVGYSVPFGTNSGLGKAFDLFGRSIESKVIHALLDKNKKSALKAFSNQHFDSPAILTFSKDWPKGDQYLEWAKGHLLDTEVLSQDLDVSKINKHNLSDLLEEEKDTRSILVNNISGLRALELLAEKLHKDSSSQSTTLSIASLFLSNLKPLLVNWMEAKMNLRSSILHNQDSHAVRLLLKSDMWSPSIFSKSALEEAEKTKRYSGLRSILNLNRDGSFKKPQDFSRKSKFPSSNRKFQDFDRSHARRSHYPSRKRDSRHNYFSKDSFRPSRSSYEPKHPKTQSTQSSAPSHKPPQKKNPKGRSKPPK